jgi:hypothetical protein
VQHFCLLLGYGAGAVNPYLAYATLEDHGGRRILKDVSADEAVKNYRKAVDKGVLKVMTKMGISTLQSYRGAQIFEAIGLESDLVARYFTWTASRIEGVGLEVLAREAQMRHDHAYKVAPSLDGDLDVGGQYQWRRRGEHHAYNPNTVAKLPARRPRRELQDVPGVHGARERREPPALHDPWPCSGSGRARRSRSTTSSPASEIVKRFKTGAMSLGSISREAHENLAIAMNRIGGSRTLAKAARTRSRYVPDPNGDLRRSAIKQVASGASASPATTSSTATSCRSRWRRAPSPARAASSGPQGRSVHREDPLLDAGRRAHLTAAAPRHLLDRGPGPADPRPQELERPGAHQREAGRRGRRRHGRRRRLEGEGRRRAHQRRLGRHRRLAAHVDQARRHPVGARPRRDAADPGRQRSAAAASASRPTGS